MKGIRIYIEGGGDSSATKQRLRLGFQDFLQSVRDRCRRHCLHWEVILCGSRGSAFQSFKRGCDDHPDEFVLLLVDSEGPIADEQSPWNLLRSRDGWTTNNVNDTQCHFMAQVMEAWFVADPEGLKAYYGAKFHDKSLSNRNNVEQIPKDELMSSLSKATAKTPKGAYHKTRHAPNLLKKIQSANVRERAPHCDRLFCTLADQINNANPM